MEEFIPCIVLVGALLPVVALILAILAFNRAERLRRDLEGLRHQLDMMARRLTTGGVGRTSQPSAPQPYQEPAERAEPARASSAKVEPTATRPEVELEGRPPERDTPLAPSREHVSAAQPGPASPAGLTPAFSPATMEGVKEASLEERLGARLFVWIGAVAMALAGVFLVKYTFDRNLLTPAVRVLLGLIFGGLFLVTGEWMRTRSARIGQGLSAAGVAVLFASLYAAVNLYDLISPIAGFALMALVTALAVVLSLRQGPFVALLGLVGGFLTPVMVRSPEPQPSLFAYLFMLELGLLAVTRRRGWALLAGLTVLGGMGWAAVWLLTLFEPQHGIWIGPFLLLSVAAFAVFTQTGRAGEAWGNAATASFLTWAATLSGLLLVSFLVRVGEFSTQEWAFLGLLGVGCLLLARFDARLEGLAWLASAAAIAMLLAWYFEADSLEQKRFGLTALAFGLLYACGPYACLWGTQSPASWLGLSVVSAIAYLLVGYFCLEGPPPGLSWGGTCLILAAAYTLGGVPVLRRRGRSPGWEAALAVVAVGVTALVSLAMPIELERAWISVAWALEIPALALIDWRLRIPVLRELARVLAVGVGIRLLFNPEILNYPIGTHPLWNWVLYGYGIPTLALATGAWLFKRSEDKGLVETLAGGAIALGFALVTLQVRQYFHPGQLGCTHFTLNEWGTFSVVWLACAWALLLGARLCPLRSVAWGGSAIAAVALVQAVVTQSLIENPLWVHHAVGTRPIVNYLLFIYGLPGLLALPVARESMRQGQPQFARVAGSTALGLFLLLVTLEVRQFFQGDFLDSGTWTSAEWYTYSVAWVLFGVLLLVLGIRTGGLVLRYASLVVMLLSVGKVFLSDTAHLRDLYRVLSLFGLGVTLLVLAYVYQRFVFRKMD